MTSAWQSKIRSVLWFSFLSLCIIASLSILSAPVFSTGQSQIEEKYPVQTAPEKCISSSGSPLPADRSFTASQYGSSSDFPITASVSRIESNASLFRINYSISPSYDGNLQLKPLKGAAPVENHGFVKGSFGSGYIWNKSTRTPSLVFELVSFEDGLEYPRGENWMIGPSLQHTGNVTLQMNPNGSIGPDFMYIGDYSTEIKKVGCQKLLLVVPDPLKPELSVSKSRIVNTVAESSRRLNVGAARNVVRMYAVEGSLGQYGNNEPSGYTTTSGNFLATASQGFDRADNVWIHEYVHTRQDYIAISGSQWTVEGTATYLTARLAVEQGLATPRQYDSVLARSEVLPNGTSLNENHQRTKYAYFWGASTLSSLEHELDESNATIEDLLRFMNRQATVQQPMLDDWSKERTNKNYSLHTVVFSGKSPEPRYLLGPSWLPPEARIVIPLFATLPLRIFSLALLIISLYRLNEGYVGISLEDIQD